MGEVSGPELALAGAGPLSQTEHGLWGATDSPGRLEPWQDKQGFPRPLDGPAAAPRTTGIRGDQLLEPAGPKTWGWRTADQGEDAAQACHLCPAPWGPLPRGSTFPSQGVTHLSSVKTNWP